MGARAEGVLQEGQSDEGCEGHREEVSLRQGGEARRGDGRVGAVVEQFAGGGGASPAPREGAIAEVAQHSGDCQ